MNAKSRCDLCRTLPIKVFCVAYGRLVIDVCGRCYSQIGGTGRRSVRRPDLPGQKMFAFRRQLDA